MAETTKVLYEEQAPVSAALQACMGAVVLLLGALLYFLSKQTSRQEALWSGLAALALVVVTFYLFLRLKFQVTGEAVEASVPLWGYRVPVEDISSVELLDRFPWYLGWGVKMWGRTLYFASQHKQSVLVHKKSGFFKQVVFTAREPMKLIAGIQAAQRLKLDAQAQAARN